MEIAATERNAVLVELETLQNDLLDRLDDLDRRVCLVLKEWTTGHHAGELPTNANQPQAPATETR